MKYLAAEDAYLINTRMKSCAVSQDQKNWKFVIFEKEYKPQLIKVVLYKI